MLGTTFFLEAFRSSNASLVGTIGAAFIVPPVILLIMKYEKIKLEFPTTKNTLVPLVGLTLIGSLANFSYNVGVSKGFTSIVAPIAGSYPTLFVVLAFIVFKVKLTKQQLFGIVVSILGIVMLSILSK